MRKYVLLVISAVVVGSVAGLVIAGLGTDDGDSTAALRSTVADGAQTGRSSHADRVPRLAGRRLDQAENQLDRLGMDHDAVGGGLFGIIDRSAWEVCETRPGAGEPARTVDVIVERPGEC